MANNGLKQATIAYRIERGTGLPVDINGELTSISGRKQAIALLTGYPNPFPALYEVSFYYNINSTIAGEPTAQYNFISCPVGFISLSVNTLDLTIATPSANIVVSSSHAWAMSESMPGLVTFSQTSGDAGNTTLTITRTATQGEGNYTFTNLITGQTVALHILNVDVLEWILTSGFWNNLGIWQDAGTWNY